MDPITAAEDHGTRQYLGHFAGHSGRTPWVNIRPEGEEPPSEVLGRYTVGPRDVRPDPACPVEIGDVIRFKPSAYFSGTAGLGMELDVIVTATVIQIHADHRWYRAEWRTPGGRILRESFKF